MLTLFQRTVIVVLAFGFLVVALVVAAKAPAQATTFAPAVSVPVNAVIPPGIVATGDATVKAKPDGAIVTVGAVVQAPTADGAQLLLSERVAKILAHTPMNRFGEAGELMGPAVFLCARKAGSFVTGCHLTVDGGFSSMEF